MIKFCLSLMLMFLFAINIYAQNVGINSSGNQPNSSAGLDVDFNDKGFLIPRVALTGTNDATTITSPAVSLLIYNTAIVSDVTPGYYYNSGSIIAPVWTKFVIGNRYIGEEYMGGIIFYLYIGSDGQQHGLIVSKIETSTRWQNTGVLVNADHTEDGIFNTGVMTDSPAKDWITTNFGVDWYLPSIDELSLLWHNRYHVNKTARNIGATLLSTTSYYWSSTEYAANSAFYLTFYSGSTVGTNKTNIYNVRAIRAF